MVSLYWFVNCLLLAFAVGAWLGGRMKDAAWLSSAETGIQEMRNGRFYEVKEAVDRRLR